MKSIQYIAKPYEDSEEEEEEEEEEVAAMQQIKSSYSLLPKSNSNRKRSTYEPSTVVSICDDVHSQPRLKYNSSQNGSSSNQIAVDLDGDDNIEFVKETRQDVAKALAQKSLASITIDLIDEDTPPSKKQKSKPTKAQQNQQIKLSKMLMQVKEVRESCNENPQKNDNVHLIDEESINFVVPKVVKSASKRALATIIPNQIKLSEIDILLGRAPSASSGSHISDQFDSSGPCVMVKTRLNDATSHEKKWKISQSKSFKELRVKVAQLYKVDESLVKLKFEGCELKDSKTPLTEDMEDDTLIEVVIPKDKHIAAVAAATQSTCEPPKESKIIDISIKVLPECLIKKRKIPLVFTSRFDIDKHLWQFDSATVVAEKLKRGKAFKYLYGTETLDCQKTIRELGLSHGSEVFMKLR